jgi:CheY-like chemotaxis protein
VDTGLNINVLVVDDNQINRLLINKVLKKWGATADFAENGQEAIDKLDAHKNFDVVLMDIHMPVMGGLEATGIIRSKTDAYFQKLPIIALNRIYAEQPNGPDRRCRHERLYPETI